MVTWHQLASIAGITVGAVLLAFGCMATFGGMMSDAPVEGEAASRKGCFAALVGLALIICSIWGFWL